MRRSVQLILIFAFNFMLLFFAPKPTYAASLIKASDTLSTSRPSSSVPIFFNQNANDSSVVISDTTSVFLPGDSAVLSGSSGTFTGTISSIISDSPTPGKRTISFTTTIPTAHSSGDSLRVNVAALHTIQFTTSTALPTGGKIIIKFQGQGSDSTDALDNTFAFNKISPSNIQANNASCTFTVSAPTITCALTSGLSAQTTVTIIIGSSAPTLLNPTKSRSPGELDPWSLNIRTEDADANSTQLDKATIKIGTVEPVTTQAVIEPFLGVSISGIGSAKLVNTANSGCLSNDITAKDSLATSTAINLGTLTNTPSTANTQVGNIAAQLISITTNIKNGYSLSAQSSGHLTSPVSGFSFPDSTTPATFPLGKAFFGIHACGSDVLSSSWTSGLTQSCGTVISGSSATACKYAWPGSERLIVSSDQTGPVGADVSSSNGQVTIEYAAGIDPLVPPGSYRTSVTYTVLPGF